MSSKYFSRDLRYRLIIIDKDAQWNLKYKQLVVELILN